MTTEQPPRPRGLTQFESDVRNGVLYPHFILSMMQAQVHTRAKEILVADRYHEIHLPTLIRSEVVDRQGTVPEERIFRVSPTHVLTGSAEQSMLDRLMDVGATRFFDDDEEWLCYATTQCYRREPVLDGLHTLYEFTKMEQIALVASSERSIFHLEGMLRRMRTLCVHFQLEHRTVENPSCPAYAVASFDVEVKTQTYGWMKVGTFTDFGTGQAERFGWRGDLRYSVFGTMAATPRFLIPLLERML